MAHIIKEASPETLLAASYEHVEAYGLFLGRAPGGEVYDMPELAWGFSGVPSPYMNMVVRTKLRPQEDIDEVIDSVLRRAHGMEADGEDPGMAIDLSVLPDHLPPMKGLRIAEVLAPSTLRQWVDAWGESYNNAPESMRESRFKFRLGLGLSTVLPYRSFLAYLDDKPVATSELFLGAGVAAAMWVGTTPEARGKGIGAAITTAPLLEARKLGYRIGTLTASPMGYHVYEQLGFQKMCRIPVYRWVPDSW
jgi:GNAT superfamily N-acetyltransferase